MLLDYTIGLLVLTFFCFVLATIIACALTVVLVIVLSKKNK